MDNKSDRITKIDTQKNNKDRVNVYVNEEFAFACSLDIVYMYHLKAGLEIKLEQLRDMVQEDNFLKCKNQSLKLIEKSCKTEKEIRDKLIYKGYEENIIERCMEFLKSYNFVNDLDYADMYIKERIKREGINKIKYSLQRKGIAKDIINTKLSLRYDEAEVIEDSSIYALAQKKYSSLIKNEEDERKIYKKLWEYLYRKGYLEEQIKSTLRNLIKKDFE